jgi:hypothetical protein
MFEILGLMCASSYLESDGSQSHRKIKESTYTRRVEYEDTRTTDEIYLDDFFQKRRNEIIDLINECETNIQREYVMKRLIRFAQETRDMMRNVMQ